jgi:hypothetical protein
MDFAVTGRQWAVELLEREGHPALLWLHPLDYQKLAPTMVPSAGGIDARGPYCWLLATQIRPKPQVAEVDVSATRLWP